MISNLWYNCFATLCNKKHVKLNPIKKIYDLVWCSCYNDLVMYECYCLYALFDCCDEIVWVISDCYVWMLIMSECDGNCVLSFPQRVDETLDVAGEGSFQATKEAVPADTVQEGMSSAKTQPLSYVLNLFLSWYYAIYHYYVSYIMWDGNYCSCNRWNHHTPSNLPMDHENLAPWWSCCIMKIFTQPIGVINEQLN